MIKPVLPFCETMITYSCNLSCQGCTNYSDYNMKGWVPWIQGREWIEAWLDRVDIPDFGIIGGEPLMNPQVKQWIRGCREIMPASQIRFTTNAVLLSRRSSVLDDLFDIGNCVIKLTLHQPSEFYTQQAINSIMTRTKWREIEEFGIKRWITDNGVRLQINFPETFVKTYRGDYTDMLPHHSDPNESFKICCQQRCPLLYENRIFKCSSIALLARVLADWKHDQRPEWQQYLGYRGIDPDCDDRELERFIAYFGKPESICQMCPTESDVSSMLPHTKNVISKKTWLQKNHH